jgi:hypothetical protein
MWHSNRIVQMHSKFASENIRENRPFGRPRHRLKKN